MDAAYLWEWASLLLRWLHVITAIAWIGASFYFIALDNSLEAPKDNDPLVRGEQWSLHGGGFYYKKKFKGAPPAMPATLHWFKWEAYWTWISGFALFALLYWGRAETYLIDPEVADIGLWTAVAASLAIIVAGWVVYDQLCKRLWGREGLITALAFLWVSVLAVIATQLFSGRGAFLVIGVTMGTAMAANVAHIIIPGQRRMVKAIEAGQAPDSKDGLAGKQRSVHNTYVTLPVLLMMLSPHYPMLTQGRWNWVSLILLIVSGALIRQFFVLRHSGRSNWALPVGGAVALGALAWLVAPRPDPRFAGVEAPPFAEVASIVSARCATCHAANPTFDGISAAPKGVVMETPAQIRRWAQSMRQQVASEAMPPGNLTDMTDEERGRILAWVAGGAKLD